MSQDYQAKHQNPNRKYFTTVPNIVFDLDLDPYEFRLYLQYCKAADSNQTSWYGNKSLSKKCDMSERKLRECKAELAKPRPELENKPLIYIEHRKSEAGDWDTDLITVIDIWHDNTKIIISTAPHAGGVRHHMPEGGAPGATKQDPSNKTNLNNNTEDSATPRVVVSSIEEKEKKDLLQKLSELNQDTLTFALTFSYAQIETAVECCIYGKPENLNGFFRDALAFAWSPAYPKAKVEAEKQEVENKRKQDAQTQIYNALRKSFIVLLEKSRDKMKEGYGFKIINNQIVAYRIGSADLPLEITEGSLNWAQTFFDRYKK